MFVTFDNIKNTINQMKSNKRFLVIIITGLFMLALVNAGLIVYYGQVTATFEVTQPITVTGGDLEQTFEDMMAGETVDKIVVIQNDADFPIDFIISDDSPEGIIVTYVYTHGDFDGFIPYNLLEGETITLSAKPENSTSDNWWVRLYISYELDNMLETGTYTVTTTIDEVE